MTHVPALHRYESDPMHSSVPAAHEGGGGGGGGLQAPVEASQPGLPQDSDRTQEPLTHS